MASKRVLNVGQCGPDHAAIRNFLSRHFDCEVAQALGAEDALTELESSSYHLVLINRKLDHDYSDGMEVVRKLKAHPVAADVPVMLITNFPEHQEIAVAAGALHGFGKLEFDKPETLGRLQAVLGD